MSSIPGLVAKVSNEVFQLQVQNILLKQELQQICRLLKVIVARWEVVVSYGPSAESCVEDVVHGLENIVKDHKKESLSTFRKWRLKLLAGTTLKRISLFRVQLRDVIALLDLEQRHSESSQLQELLNSRSYSGEEVQQYILEDVLSESYDDLPDGKAKDQIHELVAAIKAEKARKSEVKAHEIFTSCRLRFQTVVATLDDTIDEFNANIPPGEIDCPHTLENKIGEGGFGVVYRGSYKDVPVAVKTLSMRRSLSTEARDELAKEAEVWRTMKHPNIIRLYGTYIDNGEMGLVIELADFSLEGYIHDFGASLKRLPTLEVARLGREIATALEYLHDELRIVHRDIKPQNVLLKHMQVKLTDFGLTKTRHESTTLSTATGGGGGGVGTPAYMAPELFQSERRGKNSAKVDMYALGILLWEILERKRPFEGFHQYSLAFQVCQGTRPDLSETLPDDETEEVRTIRDIYKRCWDQSPFNRPTANEVKESLATIAPEDPHTEIQPVTLLPMVVKDPVLTGSTTESTSSSGLNGISIVSMAGATPSKVLSTNVKPESEEHQEAFLMNGQTNDEFTFEVPTKPESEEHLEAFPMNGQTNDALKVQVPLGGGPGPQEDPHEATVKTQVQKGDHENHKKRRICIMVSLILLTILAVGLGLGLGTGNRGGSEAPTPSPTNDGLIIPTIGTTTMLPSRSPVTTPTPFPSRSPVISPTPFPTSSPQEVGTSDAENCFVMLGANFYCKREDRYADNATHTFKRMDMPCKRDDPKDFPKCSFEECRRRCFENDFGSPETVPPGTTCQAFETGGNPTNPSDIGYCELHFSPITRVETVKPGIYCYQNICAQPNDESVLYSLKTL